MPTIIDSLLVTLGFESSGLDKGTTNAKKKIKETGDEADKTGKKLEQAGKDGADGFNELAASATKFLAVLGGATALTRFIENTIEATTQLSRFSRNLGDSASNVNAWSNATELAGGSAGDLQATMSMLSRAQTELEITGSSSMVPYLSALGVAFGKDITPAQQLLELSERFSHMDRTKANNLGLTMGINQGTMNLLLKSRPEVELMIKRQKELNDLNDKQTEVADRLSKAFTASMQSFRTFGRELMVAVAPALEKALSLFSALGDWMRDNKEFVEIFLTILAVGLGAIGAALIPINLVVVAIAGVGAALAALYQDYLVWKRGGDSFFGDDWKKIEDGVNIVINVLTKLKELLGNQFYRAIAMVDMVYKAATGDFKGAKYAASQLIEGNTGFGSANNTPNTTAQRTRSGKIGVVGGSPSADARQAFISAASAELGVDPSIIDAQLRLETGATGRSAIGAYNYGNIKTGSGWTGDSKSRSVGEYDANGNYKQENAAFRSYGDATTAGKDYASLLKRRYPGAAGASSAQEFAESLKRGGYATDPNYVNNVMRIANGIPGAAGAAQGAGASGSAQMAAAASQGAGNRSVETSIAELNIYTQATDANGIAQDMGKSIDNLYTSQYAYGLD